MVFQPIYEPRRVTQDEYLTRARADAHQQYLDGIVHVMPTESPAHRLLCRNLQHAIQPQIHGSIRNIQVLVQPLLAAAPQRPYSHVGMFTYPDVAVVMGPPEYHDDQCRALRNPVVIIEVCSPETEDFDGGEKFQRYRHGLPSLQEYVLIAEGRCEVGHYQKVGQGQWPLEVYTDLDGVLLLTRIGCRVPLTAVYEGLLIHANRELEREPSEEISAWQWHE